MLHTASQLHGFKVAALDGLAGKEADILFDDRDWHVRFFVVRTAGWLLGHRVLVAPEQVKGISDGRALLVTDLTRRQVEDAPPFAYEPPISPRSYDADARGVEVDAWPAYWGLPLGAGFFDLPCFGAPVFAPPFGAEARSRGERSLEGDGHVFSCGEMSGYRVHADDGDAGHVEDFLVDPATWRIPAVVVATRDWLPGGARVLLRTERIDGLDLAGGRIKIGGPRAAVLHAPRLDHAH